MDRTDRVELYLITDAIKNYVIFSKDTSNETLKFLKNPRFYMAFILIK